MAAKLIDNDLGFPPLYGNDLGKKKKITYDKDGDLGFPDLYAEEKPEQSMWEQTKQFIKPIVKPIIEKTKQVATSLVEPNLKPTPLTSTAHGVVHAILPYIKEEELSLIFPTDKSAWDFAGEFAGSVLPFSTLGKATAGIKMLQAAKNAPLIQKVAKGAAKGALELGAYQTVGESFQKKPIEEKAKQVGSSAVFGGILGGGTELLGSTLKTIVNKLKTKAIIYPEEIKTAREVIKNKSMLDELKKTEKITVDDTKKLEEWFSKLPPTESKISAPLPKALPPYTIKLPETLPELPPTQRALDILSQTKEGKKQLSQQAPAPSPIAPLPVKEALPKIQDIVPKGYEIETPIKIIAPKLERLKGETLDQAIARKVGYQIDNGRVKLEENPIGGWKATLSPIGAEKPQMISAYKKQDVLNEVYKKLYPEYGAVEKLPSLSGVFAGIEPEYNDEKDKNKITGFKLNPYKAALGIGVMAGVKNIPQKITRPLINESKINISETGQKNLRSMVESVRNIVEKETNTVLPNSKIIQLAKEAELLSHGMPRETVEKMLASLYRTRQHEAALSVGKGVTKEFIDSIKKTSEYATMAGQLLQSHDIRVAPELYSLKGDLVRKLFKAGIDADKIMKASEGVDFNNQEQVTKLYRTFIKPTLKEWIDEFRYINMLSSPLTHIVNTSSNAAQVGFLRPVTKLISGSYDAIGSNITGKARSMYIKEVPVYYRGVMNSWADAVSMAADVMTGKSTIRKPDLEHIPTGSKLLRPFQVIPKALEAMDVFFQKLAQGGELEALTLRNLKKGGTATKQELADLAATEAERLVFRGALDPKNATGQGNLLSKIDSLTSTALSIGNKVPVFRWIVPFIQTPMNILKQGIEYSPMGVLTLKGSINKTEQLAKASLGSIVFLGAMANALEGNSTWAIPKSKKERELFYASGKKPYSIKIGSNWISYSKLGPLAYPMAMAAALHYVANDNPKADVYNMGQKMAQYASEMAGFFGDQSYVQSVGQAVKGVQGDWGQVRQLLTNMGTQLIPLSSLQRWINRIIDPYQRQPERDFSLPSFMQVAGQSIVGGSYLTPKMKAPRGEPIKRELPERLLASVSPFPISKTIPSYEKELKNYNLAQRRRAILSERKKEALRRRKEIMGY